MRANTKVLAAAMAIAAMVAGGCSSSDKDKGKDGGAGSGGETKPKGAIEVTAENKAYAERLLQLKDAQYVRVNTLADPAAKQRVNQAMRGPLDWVVGWMAGLDEEHKKQCAGKMSVLKSTVRMGLQGPEFVSAATTLQLAPCFEADGAFPTQSVTVDLKAGKALTAADVFKPATLTRPGLQKLWTRLSGDKADWKDCGHAPMERADFFATKEEDGLPPTPGPLNLMLTQGSLEVFWSEAGSTCTTFKFSAPYAKVKELLRPEVAARLG